jgi:hypothetical protein
MADARLFGNDGEGDDIFVYTGGRAPFHVRRAKIDESIDTIPQQAFANCEQLIEVEGHKKLKKIGGGTFYEGAFYMCTSLRRVMKMNGVIEIEDHAFYGCNALSELEFDKLEIIGEGAFAICKSLRSINLPSTRRVGDSAFYGCNAITDAVFGEDLGLIDSYAFHFCTSLTHIAIPLKDGFIVEDCAFRCCASLSRVDVIGGIHKTISSLHMETWRDEMAEEINRINQTLPEITIDLNLPDEIEDEQTSAIDEWIAEVRSRMEHYKTEHRLLVKEAITLLELALWKVNLKENDGALIPEGVRVTRRQVKRARKERCITSGAGIIIKNVLPFLELDE